MALAALDPLTALTFSGRFAGQIRVVRSLQWLLAAGCAWGTLLYAQSGAIARSTTPDEAEKWRADLHFMAEEMPRFHRNLFHTMTREQFQTAVDELRARIPSLARHQSIVGMEKIAAMVGDGHTNIAPTRDPKIGFRTYPLNLYFFKDGLYLRAAGQSALAIENYTISLHLNPQNDNARQVLRRLEGK